MDQPTPALASSRSMKVCGEVIRTLRKRRGLTQEELAQKCGFSGRLIGKAESGRSIDWFTIEVLAEALSTPEDQVAPHDLAATREAIVRKYVREYRRLERDFVEELRPHFAEDFVAVIAGDPREIPFAGEWRGADGYARFWGIFFDVFERPDPDAYRPHVIVDESCVVAMGRETVTVRATGETTSSWVTLRFEFTDGRISRVEHYFDTAGTERALAGGG